MSYDTSAANGLWNSLQMNTFNIQPFWLALEDGTKIGCRVAAIISKTQKSCTWLQNGPAAKIANIFQLGVDTIPRRVLFAVLAAS